MHGFGGLLCPDADMASGRYARRSRRLVPGGFFAFLNRDFLLNGCRNATRGAGHLRLQATNGLDVLGFVLGNSNVPLKLLVGLKQANSTGHGCLKGCFPPLPYRYEVRRIVPLREAQSPVSRGALGDVVMIGGGHAAVPERERLSCCWGAAWGRLDGEDSRATRPVISLRTRITSRSSALSGLVEALLWATRSARMGLCPLSYGGLDPLGLFL